MVGLWQTTYNRVRPHSSLDYRPPAPVSYPDLAFPLPMTAAMQEPLTRPGPIYRSGQAALPRMSSQPGPARTRIKTDSGYERGRSGAGSPASESP